MILWGRATSINVQKVMWLLAELELPYERVDLGGAYGGLDSADYRALNPSGRVPTLADGPTVVWESNAILRYLADAFGRDVFWGRDAAERSRADIWMEWFQADIYPHFISAFYQTVRLPVDERSPEKLSVAAEQLAKGFSVLERELKTRPFVAGDHLTIGDIPVGACLYRYFDIGVCHQEMPAINAYYQRLISREAYKANVMTSYDALRAPAS